MGFPIRNTEARWGAVTVGLHWLTVLLVLALLAIGSVMDDLPAGGFRGDVYALHRSLGLGVLAVTLLRLGWRLVAGVPRPEPGVPRWQAAIAATSHGLLYTVLLAMPLSGWLYTSASGLPLRWFGWLPLPALTGRDRDIADFAGDLHEMLATVLVVLVAIHAAAALWHHYVHRDRTLHRMLPVVPPPASAQPANARTAPASNGQSSSAPSASRRSTGTREP